MPLPNATYRLQFRNGMTFDTAISLIPYWSNLGISHVYASPIFTATAGSTHGYDVTDPNAIDPSLGGRAGFDRFSLGLKAAGLGLILDIVPNHTAASLENAWWRDTIENGASSAYAHHFDIDWSRRLTLPFLGDDFDAVVARGEFELTIDSDNSCLSFDYFDSLYPLNPQTYGDVEPTLREPGALAAVLGDAQRRLSLQAALDTFSEDHAAMSRLHERQTWRLMSWRDAAQDLSYRRFFEVAGLVGMRVEDPAVFDDMHRLILELVHSGAVDGLRVDHVDGLADPGGYLERLRRAAGEETYIVVEKILAEGEQLPPAWPISGTSGYEFITALGHVFVGDGSAVALDQAYAAVNPTGCNLKREEQAAKQLMVTRNFAGEVARLGRLAMEVFAAGNQVPAITEDAALEAIRALLVAFPVYRTYGTQDGLGTGDRALLQTVLDGIDGGDRQALTAIAAILQGGFEGAVAAKAAAFRTRFEQLTGPVMAKAVEDTLFYRYNRLIALNEVGGDARSTGRSLAQFHADMGERRQVQPHALNATSTHDTKRGEDARTRLYAIAEAPDIWRAGVDRWRVMNRSAVTGSGDESAPDADTEWLLYQALAGAWSPAADGQHPDLTLLEERFLPYVEKALREAKRRTDWSKVNQDYEDAVKAYASRLLSPTNAAFHSDFEATLAPFARAGALYSLTQTLLKLLAPGIPDIYQGADGMDFSLVDPDNRRMPPYKMLAEQLLHFATSAPDLSTFENGAYKHWLIKQCLMLRRAYPLLFAEGHYHPLSVRGTRHKQIVAFARQHQQDWIVVVAPRLCLDALTAQPWPTGDYWADTTVDLPHAAAGARIGNLFDDTVLKGDGSLAIATALATSPVAVLMVTDKR